MFTPWRAGQRNLFTFSLRLMHTHPQRTYADAVLALNTLQSNHKIVEAIRRSTGGLNKYAIPEMLEWLHKCGHQASDFDRLNIIHIAGTKGKGSTAAFVSSLLSQYLPSASSASPLLRKIGLYTSPHLRFVRERIQINNTPISEEAFARRFFDIWERFEAAAKQSCAPTDVSAKPVYFRYLTIMALHHYLEEGVDSAIIECGIGGEYDSTNIIEHPTVTGITPLGLDHTAMLGETISSIAWHKAGIMKPGAQAYTTTQPDAAMAMLRSRAEEKGTRLQVVPTHPQIVDGSVVLGLLGAFQQMNASLAVELAAAHLRAIGLVDIDTEVLPPEFVRGLETAKLGGRCESRVEEHMTWYIDGGHTLDSIRVAAEWYVDSLSSTVSGGRGERDLRRNSRPRVLIFNQQTRAGLPLLQEIHRIVAAAAQGSGSPFDYAIFCSNITFAGSGYRPDLISINSDVVAVGSLGVQRQLAEGWEQMCEASGDVQAKVAVVRTVEEAVEEARAFERRSRMNFGERAQVLVTGSMHLVGGVLEVLETESRNASIVSTII